MNYRRISIAALLAVPALIAFIITDSYAVDGRATGWWTDANGVNHYGDPPSQSSQSSSRGSSYSSGSGYSAPDYAASMAGQVMSSLISAIQQQQMQIQQNMMTATSINDQGVQYHNNGDYDTAIRYYEEALRYNPYDTVIGMNLRKARASSVAKRGEEAMREYDLKKAAQLFRESLSYQENADVRADLNRLEDMERQEAEDRMHQANIKQAKARVDNMLGSVASQLEAASDGTAGEPSGGLDFMGKTYSAKEAPKDQAALDIGTSKGEVIGLKEKEKGVHYKDVPVPKGTVPEWDPYSASSKAEIILDAIKEGNHNWDNSAAYLENYLRTKNGNNMKVREALSYIEGLRAGAAFEKTAVKAKTGDPFAASASDTAALMPVLAGRKDTPWPGPKNPNPGEMAPNPLQWKVQRTELLLDALQNGKKNWDTGVAYLDAKIKKDPLDFSAIQAKAYLEGFRAYHEFTQDKK